MVKYSSVRWRINPFLSLFVSPRTHCWRAYSSHRKENVRQMPSNCSFKKIWTTLHILLFRLLLINSPDSTEIWHSNQIFQKMIPIAIRLLPPSDKQLNDACWNTDARISTWGVDPIHHSVCNYTIEFAPDYLIWAVGCFKGTVSNFLFFAVHFAAHKNLHKTIKSKFNHCSLKAFFVMFHNARLRSIHCQESNFRFVLR